MYGVCFMLCVLQCSCVSMLSVCVHVHVFRVVVHHMLCVRSYIG